MRHVLFASLLAFWGCSNEPVSLQGRTAVNQNGAKPAEGDATGKKSSNDTVGTDAAAATVAADAEKDAGAATPVEEKTADATQPGADVTGPQFSVSAPQEVNQNLGVSKTYTYTLTPAAGFTGKVDMSIDKTDLATVDTANGAKISASPATVDFAGGKPQTVTVTVDVGTISPSVKATDAAGHFKLIGAIGANKIETNIGLNINPVFEVQMKGSSAATMVYTPNTTVMDFKSHPAGLKLRFINMDPAATNVVHGNNPIPHGPTGSPLAASPDGGVTAGGAYEVDIAPTTTGAGRFYSHSYEGGGAARTINFGK